MRTKSHTQITSQPKIIMQHLMAVGWKSNIVVKKFHWQHFTALLVFWGVWVNGGNSHLRLQCSTFTQIFQRCYAYEEHLKNKYKFSSQNRIHSFDFTKYANWTKSTVCLHVGVLWNIHISLQQNKHTKHCNSWHSKWKQRIPLQRCCSPVRCINNLLLCYCVSLINQLAKSFRTQTT